MPNPVRLIVFFLYIAFICLGETCLSVITVTENRELTGNDCSKNHSSSDYTCATLQSALSLGILRNSSCSVTINVPPGNHKVTERVIITAASVDITGTNAQDTFVQCYFSSSSSEHMLNYTIFFQSCASVKLSELTMQNCSVPVGFDTVSKIHIENTRVRSFTDTALEIYNCKLVLISESLFINNSGRGTRKVPFRGNTGAVSIGYYKFSSGQNCMDNETINVTVLNSTFRDNAANADGDNHRSTSHAFFRGILTGRAGGLGVFINESYCNANITVSDCTFEGNFAKSFGGGLYYVYSGNTSLRHAQFKGYVLNSTFIRNSAGFGAGGFITTIESAGPKNLPHLVYVEGCKFYENIADIAGGLYYYVVYQGGSGSSLIINGTEFSNNSGNFSTTGFGSALVASIYHTFNATEGFPLHEITNCNFTSNYGSTTTVSIGYIPFSVYGHNIFSNNVGTALMIVGAQVSMKGDVKFTNNSADDGGALKLVSYAQMKLHENTTITFSENKGRIGASIVVGPFNQAEVFKQLTHNPQCFILLHSDKLQDNNTHLIFEQNKASFGSAIYVQSNLSQCSWINQSNFDISHFPHWPIFELQNNNNTGVLNNTSEKYSIITDALSVETNLSQVPVKAWPGKNIGVTISSTDQLGSATGTSLRMIPPNSSRDIYSQVHLSPNAFFEDKKPFLTNFKFSLLNKTFVNKNQTISVLPLGTTVLQKVFKVNFSFQVEDCPAGYSLTPMGNDASISKRYHCVCTTQRKEILQCREDQIIIQSGLWATTNIELNLQFIPCPSGYCQCLEKSHVKCLHAFNQSNPDQQCFYGRKGTLCGECEEGRLRTVLTDQCHPDSSCLPKESVYFFIPLTLLFIAVIVIIVLIDKPLPAWIHPLLFYVQMFPLVTHFFPHNFHQFGKYLHYASSLLGFYLPYDVCIQGLSAHGVLNHSLRLALPLFSMVIGFAASILIKYLCCKSRRLQAYFGSSAKMHGVYTVLLLIFPNALFNAFRSFNCPAISFKHEEKLRWYLDGSIECFREYHIIPVLLSVPILLIFVSPIPILIIRMKKELPRWVEKFFEACSYHYEARVFYWWLSDALSKAVLITLLVFLPRNELALILDVYVIIGISSYVSPYKTKLANHFQIIILSLCAFLLSFETVWNSGDATINTLVSMLIVTYYVPLVFLLLGLLREVLMYTRILPKLRHRFERMEQHRNGYRRLNTINGRCTSEISKTEVSVHYGAINISS